MAKAKSFNVNGFRNFAKCLDHAQPTKVVVEVAGVVLSSWEDRRPFEVILNQAYAFLNDFRSKNRVDADQTLISVGDLNVAIQTTAWKPWFGKATTV